MSKAMTLEIFNSRWKRDPDGCHIWTGAKRAGYGRLQVDGRVFSAHRWIFEQCHGYVPPVVMHRCDKPACVRLECLSAGSQLDNIADRVSKGRTSHASRNGGRRNPSAKLTAELVGEIRDRYASGHVTQSELGREYGVTRSAIGLIVNGKNWSTS